VTGIEPVTPCLQSVEPNLPNLAGAGATRLEVTGCEKPGQLRFRTVLRLSFAI
jgi:hypothetical protein